MAGSNAFRYSQSCPNGCGQRIEHECGTPPEAQQPRPNEYAERLRTFVRQMPLSGDLQRMIDAALAAGRTAAVPSVDVERLARALCWNAHGVGPCVAMKDHRHRAEGIVAEYAHLSPESDNGE